MDGTLNNKEYILIYHILIIHYLMVASAIERNNGGLPSPLNIRLLHESMYFMNFITG